MSRSRNTLSPSPPGGHRQQGLFVHPLDSPGLDHIGIDRTTPSPAQPSIPPPALRGRSHSSTDGSGVGSAAQHPLLDPRLCNSDSDSSSDESTTSSSSSSSESDWDLEEPEAAAPMSSVFDSRNGDADDFSPNRHQGRPAAVGECHSARQWPSGGGSGTVFVQRTTYSKSASGEKIKDTMRWTYMSSDGEKSPTSASAFHMPRGAPPVATAVAPHSSRVERPMSASVSKPKPYLHPSLLAASRTAHDDSSSDSGSDSSFCEVEEQCPEAPMAPQTVEIRPQSASATNRRVTNTALSSPPSFAERYRGSVRSYSKQNTAVRALPSKKKPAVPRRGGWDSSSSDSDSSSGMEDAIAQ